LQEYLLKAHRQYRLTTLLVSHHLPEIFRLADEVIVLEKGRVISYGTPASVFALATPFNAPGEIIAITPFDFDFAPSDAPITPPNASFTISVRCAGTVINIPSTAAEASALHPGQQVIVRSDVFLPKIVSLP